MEREIRNEVGEQAIYDNGILQGMYPGKLAMVRGHWIHFVPWWKPKEVLILGYGVGTMSRIIRRVWGDDVNIIGVDIEPVLLDKKHKDVIIQMDAEKFARQFPNDNAFDFVMVDVYNGDKLPAFVECPDFVKECVRLTSDVVAVNVIDGWNEYDPYRAAMDLKVTKIINRNYLYFYGKRSKM